MVGDPLRLDQVVVNLLTNAVKYADEKGSIIINLGREKDRVKLSMANTGALIPNEALEHIWNSFFRADNSRKGYGLGLAIVKSIVSLHHGSCRAYTSGDFNWFEIIL